MWLKRTSIMATPPRGESLPMPTMTALVTPNDSVEDCTAPDVFVDNNNDCDDSDPAVNPDAEEIPGDGVEIMILIWRASWMSSWGRQSSSRVKRLIVIRGGLAGADAKCWISGRGGVGRHLQGVALRFHNGCSRPPHARDGTLIGWWMDRQWRMTLRT